MKLIKYIYKTRTLSEYGQFILASLLLLLIAGNLFIPEYKLQKLDAQLLKLKGKHFKYADDLHVSQFLQSVQQQGGYICLGTSESGTLRDGNYYEFLDQDTSYDTRFSILGGAGWTCGLHMTMLLNHAEEVNDLNLIYFINPVYWRSELSEFNKGYWSRYLNYGAYLDVDVEENNGFSEISEEYSNVLNVGEKFLYRAEYWFRKIRKPFFQDLRYHLFPDKYLNDLEFKVKPKSEYPGFEFRGIIDHSYIDTSWNVTYEFMSRTWLNPMSDNDYRFRELASFINLCNHLDVNITFVLGPVNEIYIQKYHPPYFPAYIQIVEDIRAVLDDKGADYVDATALGKIPGSFIDNQHHSSYGAHLIYQMIKNHLHEKESH